MTIDLMDGHLIILRIKSDPYIYGPVLSSLCKPRNLILRVFCKLSINLSFMFTLIFLLLCLIPMRPFRI